LYSPEDLKLTSILSFIWTRIWSWSEGMEKRTTRWIVGTCAKYSLTATR